MSESKRMETHAAISWQYWISGIIFLPLGIGLFLLVFGWRKWKNTYLDFFDSHIIVHNQTGLDVALTDIKDVSVSSSKWEAFFDVATLKLTLTNQQVHEIPFLKQAQLIQQSIKDILKAIEAEKKRQIKPRETEYDDLAIGGLERYNDLVGLWQAGLISDEDFYQEQSKFKS